MKSLQTLILFLLILCRLFPSAWLQNATFSSETYSAQTEFPEQYSEPKPTHGSYMTASMIIRYTTLAVGALGIMDNLMVLIVMLRSKTLRNTFTNQFIVNQSVIDLCASFFILAANAINDVAPDALGTGLAQELYCRLWVSKIFMWGTFISSSLNLVGLTLERYYAIVHPFHHSQHFTKNKAHALMFLAWFVGIGYQASWVLPITTIRNGLCLTGPVDFKIQQAVNIIALIFEYFLPLVAISFAYMGIFIKLKNSNIDSLSQSGIPNLRDERMKKARLNVIKTLFKVFACFLICWTPNTVVFAALMLYNKRFHGSIYHISILLLFANSCANPIIYTLSYKQFQEELFAMYCCLIKRRTSKKEEKNKKGNKMPEACEQPCSSKSSPYCQSDTTLIKGTPTSSNTFNDI